MEWTEPDAPTPWIPMDREEAIRLPEPEEVVGLGASHIAVKKASCL